MNCFTFKGDILEFNWASLAELASTSRKYSKFILNLVLCQYIHFWIISYSKGTMWGYCFVMSPSSTTSNATVGKGMGYSLSVCTLVFEKSLRPRRCYKKENKGIEMQENYNFDNTTLLPTFLLVDQKVHSM